MKINRIKIDHFGGLSNFSLSFSNGFNLVFGQNEDGKSTVLSFIRMMFYGDATKVTSLNVNLRRRFSPFSGERMGGEIEFTHEGKDYLLSKQFGKTPRTDKTILFDVSQGEPITVEGEVGEMLFNMSCAAFERSIFISGFTPAEDGSAELSAKLASTMYSGEQNESFGEVENRLLDAQMQIHTSRKKGSADRLLEALGNLENEKNAALENENRRKEKLRLLNETEETLLKLSAQKENASDLLKAASEKERLGEYKNELMQRESLAALEKENSGLTAQKLAEAENLIKAATNLRASARANKEICKEPDQPNEDFSQQLDTLLSELGAKKQELALINGRFDEASAASTSGSSAKFFVPAAMFAASAVGAIFNLFLLVFLAPAIVFAILGITSASGKNRGKIERETKLLELGREKAAVEDEIKTLNDQYLILNERKKLSAESREKAVLEREKILADAEDKLLKADEAEHTAAELLGTEKAALSEALDICRKRLERISALKEFLAASALASLSDDELKSKVALPADDSLLPAEEYSREIRELEKSINEAHALSARLRTENENLLRLHRTIGVIENDIEDAKKSLAEQEEHFSSLSLARDVLAEAYDEMRRNFAPELNKKTSELLEKLTGGKHARAAISNDLQITVSQEGEIPFSADYLSSGGGDQAELCLRLALAELTAGDRKLPLLLDDVLMQYDDTRAALATEFFSNYGKENQVLLFTCHGFFKELAEAQNANIVLMK